MRKDHLTNEHLTALKPNEVIQSTEDKALLMVGGRLESTTQATPR
jgi:hypothetical protein